MATSMPNIPFSNPAGKNGFTASPIATKPISSLGSGAGTIPGGPTVPGTPVSTTNPAMPPSGSMQPFNPGAAAGGQSSASDGFITSGTDAGQNALQKQLTDIYGKGTGASLFSLLNNMSGTDSTILQEYIKSLQPQMASAQANTNAALGAGGVSANSSVAALADANLQSQEFASIASESAALTQHQEDLTSQILQGTEGAAAKEVATSGWSIFGDVMNNITGDIGNIVSGGSFRTPGNTPTIPGGSPIATAGAAASGLQATDPALYSPPQIASEDAAQMLPFS